MTRTAKVAGLVLAPLLAAAAVVGYRARAAGRLDAARAAVGTRSAEPLLDRLRQSRPGDPDVYLLSARQARLAGRPAEAAAYLDRATALGAAPAAVERERLLNRAAADPAAARPELDRALAADPADADVLLALADGELAAGRPEAATAFAGRVLERSPAHTRALTVRGAAWLNARRLDLARADLEASAAAGPDALSYPTARIKLATCRLDQGEFGPALDLFRAAHKDDPADLVAAFGVGQAAGFAGRNDEAEAAFRAVLSAHPGHTMTRLALAQLVEVRGDMAGALGLLEEAERAEPDRLETQTRLAKVLAALGKDEAAAAHDARYRELNARLKPGHAVTDGKETP